MELRIADQFCSKLLQVLGTVSVTQPSLNLVKECSELFGKRVVRLIQHVSNSSVDQLMYQRISIESQIGIKCDRIGGGVVLTRATIPNFAKHNLGCQVERIDPAQDRRCDWAGVTSQVLKYCTHVTGRDRFLTYLIKRGAFGLGGKPRPFWERLNWGKPISLAAFSTGSRDPPQHAPSGLIKQIHSLLVDPGWELIEAVLSSVSQGSG